MDSFVRSWVLSAVRSDFGALFLPLQTLWEHSLELRWWQTQVETSLMPPLEKGQRLEGPWAGAGQGLQPTELLTTPRYVGGENPKYSGMKQLHVTACG